MKIRFSAFPLLLALLSLSTPIRYASGENQGEPPEPTAQDDTVLVTREITGQFHPQFRPKMDEVIKGTVEQTNQFRKSEKLPPLKESETLGKAAQAFADYMARTGRYGHRADGTSPVERAQKSGYEVCFLAENIGMQFKSNGMATGPLLKTFFQGWKNSPPHRANLLNAAVTEIGVGFAQSADTGAYFGVQLFGRPQSEAIRIEVYNDSAMPQVYRLGEEEFSLPTRFHRQHTLCSPAMLILKQDDDKAPGISLTTGTRYRITGENKIEVETFDLPEANSQQEKME